MDKKKQFTPEDLTWKEIDFDVMIKDRGLIDAEHHLGLSPSELVGKDILDVGSGKGILAEELAEKGVKVFPLDVFHVPKLHYPGEKPKEVLEVRSRAVRAMAEHLPYKDESFDVILSMFSVTLYTPDANHLKQILREMLRVLKPGGVIRIGPLSPEDYKKTGQMDTVTYDETIECLDAVMAENPGISYELQSYPGDSVFEGVLFERVLIRKIAK